MVDKNLKYILSDRFESWELCEFLQIDIEDFIERYENEIEEQIEDVKELAGLRGYDDEGGSDDLS